MTSLIELLQRERGVWRGKFVNWNKIGIFIDIALFCGVVRATWRMIGLTTFSKACLISKACAAKETKNCDSDSLSDLIIVFFKWSLSVSNLWYHLNQKKNTSQLEKCAFFTFSTSPNNHCKPIDRTIREQSEIFFWGVDWLEFLHLSNWDPSTLASSSPPPSKWRLPAIWSSDTYYSIELGTNLWKEIALCSKGQKAEKTYKLGSCQYSSWSIKVKNGKCLNY